MPTIKIDKLAGGPITFNYTISTPSSASAKKIEPKLPTVLFLHPVYIPSEVFTLQFGDPKIRQFNLVAVDLRAHGDTKGKIPADYGQEMAAADIARFMHKMRLPACHIVALSLGTIIALQLAVSYPDKVLSLFLISPLGLEEREEVAEGRHAIFDSWHEGWQGPAPDEEMLTYAVRGALQLAFNDTTSPLVQALVACVLPYAKRNWNAAHLDDYRITTLDFLLYRRPHSIEELRNIKVPVKLVHCLGDVAYPVEDSEEFLKRLHDADVEASLESIQEASHFGNVEHHEVLNPILHDFLVRNTDGRAPPVSKKIVSPWEATLKKNGWVKDIRILDDSDDDE